jgi:hypothetical protein
VLAWVASLSVLAQACGQPWLTTRTESATAPPEIYKPELGELMTLQQIRHTKLWLAGQAENWQLAAYEADELGEGFDAIVKYQPTHEGSPIAPKDAIPRMVTQPLADVRSAVASEDRRAFAAAYDALTAACNNCHQATNFGFNRMQRPETNPYPNQIFSPPPR